MKVLVTGGRDYGTVSPKWPEALQLRGWIERDWLVKALDSLHLETPITHLTHGGAPGADFYAAEWAQANNIPTTCFPADWKLHGRSAGPIRNSAMIAAADDDTLVVAFPGGRGTADTVSKAKKAGLRIFRVGNP